MFTLLRRTEGVCYRVKGCKNGFEPLVSKNFTNTFDYPFFIILDQENYRYRNYRFASCKRVQTRIRYKYIIRLSKDEKWLNDIK